MKRPNVLLVLTDDQGYGDLSCMGSETVRTPRIDALAAAGVRCTSWYSGSAVCSPSRASLLTGRFPGNAGVRSILAGHRTASGMPAHVPTIARMLGDAGYATFLSGKWHLGASRACWPDAHGFQRWFGFVAGCVDYFSHIFYWGMNTPGPGINPTHDLWEDGREVWHDGDYLTDLITDRAVAGIRDAHRSGRPFLGYVAYNAPHYPMHAPERYRERFAHLPWDRQLMAAMLAAVDDGVGRIGDELDRLGIADDTIIVFTSDNGPSRESRNWLDGRLDPYYGGSTAGLKGWKFSLFEGGIRVPGIVRWPGAIPAGTVSDAAIGSFDVAPTVLAACGVAADHAAFDGMDVRRVLAGDAPSPDRDLLWELGGQTAIRRGRWKLVLRGQLEEAAPVDEVFLADLASDRGERVNLAAAMPDVAGGMRARAERWREALELRWRSEFADGGMHVTAGRT
ncbi:MAG TPA: sulfatase-like hydrolase/transferase [Planctomycetota bacterium]|nr:sulfatase-like hydrolase/transferase [Planctomycetota bacterium]